MNKNDFTRPPFLPNGDSHCSTNLTLRVSDLFYVLYDGSSMVYGCDTTALVYGQMQHFLLLEGDHRKEYAGIINKVMINV